jgi:hypothetical protein
LVTASVGIELRLSWIQILEIRNNLTQRAGVAAQGDLLNICDRCGQGDEVANSEVGFSLGLFWPVLFEHGVPATETGQLVDITGA